MQAAGGGRDKGQEGLSVLQVVEAVFVHLAFGGVDEHAIGVRSMPKRSVATDVVAGTVELVDHGDVDDQVSLAGNVGVPTLILIISIIAACLWADNRFGPKRNRRKET